MQIAVQAEAPGTLEAVWQAYTTPEDIMRWNAASDDWHTTASQVDLREGGTFSSRMEAKDGSFGFDFEGTYTRIIPLQQIDYDMGGRGASVTFAPNGSGVTVTVTFDAETEHPIDLQRVGWQAILDRFAAHCAGLAQ